MEAITEMQHKLMYGKTAALLDAENKARLEKVMAGIVASETKRAADREKKAVKKAVAATAAVAAVTPAVIVATIPAGVTVEKKKRGKKEKDEVFQSVADAKLAARNTAANKKYCEHELNVHKKLLADEIVQNNNKVYQLQRHEMESIKRTHDYALMLLDECKGMSIDSKQQVIKHIEKDTTKQQKEAETRSNDTARVLTRQQEIHKGHFRTEDFINANLCDRKTALTKEYNEKKNSAFSHAKFSHIVNFTKLDKTHFDGEKDATLDSIYTNASRYTGIPAQRPKTFR